MAASLMALKLCESKYDNFISYEKLHELQGRATPIKMMRYRLAIQLYKVYNAKMINDDWIDLNFQQNFNGRNNHVQINDVSKSRIRRNTVFSSP